MLEFRFRFRNYIHFSFFFVFSSSENEQNISHVGTSIEVVARYTEEQILINLEASIDYFECRKVVSFLN